MPAIGMETSTPLAIVGSNPIGENSVVPMPNAPTARANKGKLIFIQQLRLTAAEARES